MGRFRERARGRQGRPRVAVLGAVALAVLVSPAAAAPALARAAVGPPGDQHVTPVPGGRSSRPGTAAGQARQASALRQIILPDLLVVMPSGMSRRQLSGLGRIPGLRAMIVFAGARITADGRPVNVIGVNPATFRSWVPLRTASDQAFWTALGKGDFTASPVARSRLRLRPGTAYRLLGRTPQQVRFGRSARLGIAGVDLLVNQQTSARLGLVRRVAGLISAPGVSMTRLTSEVSAVLGRAGKIVPLRSRNPVRPPSAGAAPASYLQLFKAAAADYCPGLSWTVLAAIGQIESADGTNMGPSRAGALGPMQFLPSTWARWGIDAFGQSGPPSVVNPYDAVPSAARLLCADGAAAGGKSLYHAIFDYNHAAWYVREVLALAAQYAAAYS